MEFDRDNAKEEVIEYSDLEDHFPADLFQEKEKDMDTKSAHVVWSLFHRCHIAASVFP